MLFPDGVASDDLYALLGVSPKAPSHDLEIAWRTEVQRWHPDRNRDPLATSRTAFINVAHGILRDPAHRAQFDAGGLARPSTPRRDHAPKPPTAEEARWRGWKSRWAAEEERGRRFQEYYDIEKKMYAFYSAREPNGLRHFREALDTALLALPLLLVNVRDALQQASEVGLKDWFPAPWSVVTRGLSLAALFQDEGALDQNAAVLTPTGSWRPGATCSNRPGSPSGTFPRFSITFGPTPGHSRPSWGGRSVRISPKWPSTAGISRLLALYAGSASGRATP